MVDTLGASQRACAGPMPPLDCILWHAPLVDRCRVPSVSSCSVKSGMVRLGTSGAHAAGLLFTVLGQKGDVHACSSPCCCAGIHSDGQQVALG